MHVRGSLLYNDLVRKKGLEDKYRLIQSGDKIKTTYLRVPNPIRENAISSPGELPPEFGLDEYVDYDAQFVKYFIQPLKSFTDPMGWQVERVSSLEDVL